MAEVVGLVLGGIPLLISAVEHYEECFRILNCMLEFKSEYRKCLNRVKEFKMHYEMTLDQLFVNVVDSLEELERLKTCPTDDGWIEIGARLKERLLPKLHTAYLDTMKDLMEVMEELGEELGVDKAAFQERLTVTSTTDSTSRSRWSTLVQRSQRRISYEVQRVKFSQGKKRRDDLLDQIDGYIKSLDALLAKNDDVAKLLRAKTQPTTPVHRQLLEFWCHARNVHSLLSLSWICACASDHCADLRLLHRETPDVQFDICFRFSRSSLACAGGSWVCHRAVVAEMKSVSQSCAYLPSVAIPEKEQRDKVGAPLLSALKPSKKPGVAHAVATVSAVSFAVMPGFAGNTLTSRPRVTVQAPEPALNTIQDLCRAISEQDDSHPCSGLLAGQSISTEYSLQSSIIHQNRSNDTVTLTSVLSDPATRPDRTQRYSIALAVASSHLQLHSTSWLGRRWSSDDIIFDLVDGTAVVSQPYLRTSFEQQSAGKVSVDETFTTLGIVLLELCFGTTLEQSPFRRLYQAPDGRPDPVMDLAAAQKWAERVEGEAGPEYADAVDWCLGMRRVRVNNTSWRQDLVRTVIEPIGMSYQKLTSVI